MVVGPLGAHGVLARYLVATVGKSACASVTIPYPSMAENSVKDLPENFTIVKKMIAQVISLLCFELFRFRTVARTSVSTRVNFNERLFSLALKEDIVDKLAVLWGGVKVLLNNPFLKFSPFS